MGSVGGINDWGRQTPPGRLQPKRWEEVARQLAALVGQSQSRETPRNQSPEATIAPTIESGNVTSPAAPTPSASPEQVASLLSQPGYALDASRVSTGSYAPGETAAGTQSELVLDNANPSLARAGVSYEVARQMLARSESDNRAQSAAGEATRLRDGQKSLNAQRQEADDGKKARKQNAQDGQKQVEAGSEQLQRDGDRLASIKAAGENTHQVIHQREANIQGIQTQRDSAATDVQASQQSAQAAQQQLQSAQQAASQPPPSTPPGQAKQGKGTPAQGAPQARQGSWAAAQDAVSGAQRQLDQAQQHEEAARRREQQAQAALATEENALAADRQNLDQVRGQLDAQVGSRRSNQGRQHRNKQVLQGDLDRVRDLAGQTRDIHTQMQEVDANLGSLEASEARNRTNARAAQRNVEQLQTVERTLGQRGGSEQPDAAGSDALSPQTTASASAGGETLRPLDQSGEADGRTQPTGVEQPAGARVEETEDRITVQLESLGDGTSSLAGDGQAGAGRSVGYVEEDGDLGGADLAAAAPEADSGSGSSSLSDGGASATSSASSGPPGLAKKGGLPPGQAKKLA